MRNRLILIALLVVVIIGLAVFMFGESVEAPLEFTPPVEDSSSFVSTETATSSTLTAPLPITKDGVWQIWTDYLSYAKDKNIEGLKSLSYKVSESCSKPELKKECEEKMSAVYNIGSAQKKEAFSIFYADTKQAVLKTEVKFGETDEAHTATQGKIIFAVNPQGKMSLLYLDPAEIWSFKKNTGSTTAEIKARLVAFSLDSDMDGQNDDLEKCKFPDNWLVFVCNETNPNKRDSDGDGWWDGVEVYFQN